MATIIDPNKPKHTITFRTAAPIGRTTAVLTLDADEIFPDDPGRGTPALIREGRADATFWFAEGEGEDADGNRFSLPVCDWIHSVSGQVHDWLDVQTKRKIATARR